MARQKISAIDAPYETDPTRIANTSTFSGGVKGLVGAAAGGIANSNLRTGRAMRKGIGDFLSIGSNEGKPFHAHGDPSLDPANAAAAPATVQAQGPKKAATPSVVSEAQAAEIPKPLANVVQSSGIGALGGNPEVNAAVEKSAGTPPPSPAATSAATAQPPKVQPIDGGSGYAVVNGKRINYQDIGASGDPLKKSGGYVMTKGVSAIDAPADPNIGAADREYNREVRQAQTVQDQLNLSGIGVMSPAAARQSIAFRQGQQELDQRGAMVDIAAQREANDADYQNKALAINAPLIEAKAKKELSDAAVNQFAISPEGIRKSQEKQLASERKDAQKFLTDRQDHYHKSILENPSLLDVDLTKYARAVGKDLEDLTPEDRQSVADSYVKSQVTQDLRQRASGSKEAQTAIVAGKLKQAEALLKAQAKNLQPGRNLPGQDSILNEVISLRNQLKQLQGAA